MAVIVKSALYGARADRDTGDPDCFDTDCARCGKTVRNSKALVHWYGVRTVKHGIVNIVLHAGCALTWAAHLTADGIDARNASRSAK